MNSSEPDSHCDPAIGASREPEATKSCAASDVDRIACAPESVTVAVHEAGERLDAVAARHFPRHSRARLKAWIEAGHLTVDGATGRGKQRLAGGECLSLTLPESALGEGSLRLEDAVATAMPLPIVHEDDAILVLDKPAGLVMHPAAGHRDDTLVNGLLHYLPSLREVPRAGVVHRLDRDTTGLCVVAKTLEAQTHLVRQLQARSMGRRYLALVLGDPQISGTVDAPMARHPRDRKRMAVVSGGKAAVTHYEVMTRYGDCALLECKLDTGRTHQIRVHMQHIGHPLIGDPVYGRRAGNLPTRLSRIAALRRFPRQALHARELTLVHPDAEQVVSFTASPPEDFRALLAALDAASD
ncbi:MAG: RNA pseudouridine synthase [Gammaproteobacteria bacterium]|nr:MAG: RNA pseudouridine synthase [Gammaproteobacteria bacterium]PIE36740.1 MAG: RNA pseudouridine synthase [Gammaproteobacteria bacterium]